jgi:hypothetical protein
MPHPSENILSWPDVVEDLGWIKVFSLDGEGRVLSDATVNVYPHDELCTSLIRAASVHTAIDSVGWRDPLPYEAQVIKTELPPQGWGFGQYKDPKMGVQYWNPNISTVEMYSYRYYGQKTPLLRHSEWFINNLRNWTKTRALAKLNRSDVMLGVTFAERKKTYRMVVSLIGDCVQFIRDVRRGRFGRIWQRARKLDIFSWWLTYRYGISQLFRDVEGSLKLIEDIEEGEYERLSVYTTAKTELEYSEPSITRTVMGGKITYRCNLNGTETCFTRYDFDLRDADYVTLIAAGVHPLPIIWEIIPYSFVLDWFLNIGKFLEAMCYTPGYHFKGGSSTVVGVYEEKGTFEDGTYFINKGSPKDTTNEVFEFMRFVEENPLPAFAINPEVLIGMMSPTRIMDAVSLLMKLR